MAEAEDPGRDGTGPRGRRPGGPAGRLNASLTVVYWRDIPAQVVARTRGGAAGRRPPGALRTLPGKRFDRAAMRAGLAGSDDYLGQWRRGEPIPAGHDPEAEADALARRIETEFTDEVLDTLVAAGGRADP